MPPGRAEECTRPLPIGSPATGNTIGMTDVACFAAIAASVPPLDNDIDFEPDELGRDFGGPLGATLRPAIFDRDGATFDPTEFAQPLHKSGDPLGLGGRRARAKESDRRQSPAAARAPQAATPPPRRRAA